MQDLSVRLAAVGDVFVDRPDPSSMFAETRSLLADADILFGNCEGVYSDRASPAPSAPHAISSSPRMARVLGHVGFSVMSGANNHSGDGGHHALADTLETLHELGIATCGAGPSIEQARAPAVLERKNLRVAFLAYSCVFPHGYEARPGVPGLAPIRVHTQYMPTLPNFWNPGVAAEAITLPHPPDIEALRKDIELAARKADFVVVSCHWGDSSRPVHLMPYERELAHLAIDCGADAVIGHHHHSLRGVEFYQGKPILYGLGAFAFDLPNIEHHFSPEVLERFRQRFGEYAIGPREGYPTYPFHLEYRMTVLAYLNFTKGGTTVVELVPCEIQPEGHPRAFSATSEEGQRIVGYLGRVTREEGLTTRYVPSASHGEVQCVRAVP